MSEFAGTGRRRGEKVLRGRSNGHENSEMKVEGRVRRFSPRRAFRGGEYGERGKERGSILHFGFGPGGSFLFSGPETRFRSDEARA